MGCAVLSAVVNDALFDVKPRVDNGNTLYMQVYGLPTLILFKDGAAIEGSKREGAIAMKGLQEWLESNGLAIEM